MRYWDIGRSNQTASLPYDAKALCAPQHWKIRFPSGELLDACITSPNTLHVPLFEPKVPDLHCRRDGRYHIDDIMQHPQVLTIDIAFFACIDLTIYDRDDIRWILRHELQVTSDFQFIDGSNLGVVQKYIKAAMEAILNDQNKLYATFLKSTAHQAKLARFTNDYRHLKFCITISTIVFDRVTRHPQPFDETLRSFVDFQRLSLCVRAWFAYAYRMARLYWQVDPGPKTSGPKTIPRFVGAFTFYVHEVEAFHRIGVPVWYVRPWPLPGTVKVYKQVAWSPVDLVSEEANPRFPSCGHGPRNRHTMERMFACANMPRELQNDPSRRDELLETHLSPRGKPLELQMWKHPDSWTLKSDAAQGVDDSCHLPEDDYDLSIYNVDAAPSLPTASTFGTCVLPSSSPSSPVATDHALVSSQPENPGLMATSSRAAASDCGPRYHPCKQVLLNTDDPPAYLLSLY